MITRLFIIVLLALVPLISYCQEEQPEENNFHIIEGGFGAGYLHDTYEALNVAFSNSLGKYMGNFIDYNIYVNNSKIQTHELSFKFGPYLRLSKFSYLAVSSGISLFMNSSQSNWRYINGLYTYEDSYLLSIPVQVKLNFEVGKGVCFGLKGNYNFMMEKRAEDRQSAMIYLAYGW